MPDAYCSNNRESLNEDSLVTEDAKRMLYSRTRSVKRGKFSKNSLLIKLLKFKGGFIQILKIDIKLASCYKVLHHHYSGT